MAGVASANLDIDERFNTIKQRNMFGLKDPPPPPEPPPEPPPTTTVKITGTMKLMGTKRAILLVQEQGKQPESKIFKEGETIGAIEVKEIDPAGGTAKIVNNGREMTISLSKDGVTPAAGPAAGAPATAAVPGGAPGSTPFPAIPNPAMNAAANAMAARSFGNANNGNNTAGTPFAGGAGFAPGVHQPVGASVGSPVAGINFKFDKSEQNPVYNANPNPGILTYEEQIAMALFQELENQKKPKLTLNGRPIPSPPMLPILPSMQK